MKDPVIDEFEINNKSIMILTVLAILPNVMSVINFPTVLGFKIHTFQYAIFIAAAIYGPIGGAISGGIGSLFISFMLQNPLIAMGNILLGFMTGYFIKRGIGIIQSVFLAFAIQIPWLYFTDTCLKGMSHTQVINIITALFISNFIWVIAAKYTYKKIEKIAL